MKVRHLIHLYVFIKYTLANVKSRMSSYHLCHVIVILNKSFFLSNLFMIDICII